MLHIPYSITASINTILSVYTYISPHTAQRYLPVPAGVPARRSKKDHPDRLRGSLQGLAQGEARRGETDRSMRLALN